MRKHAAQISPAPARPRAAPRVLLVTPGGLGERGGIGRLVNHVVARCARTGGDAPRFIVIDPWGPRNLALMPFFFARALTQILWHVARGHADLMHVNMASWGSVARKGVIIHLAALARLPVVLHLHAGDLEAFYGALPRPGRWFVRGLFRRAERVVVLGEPWRRFLLDLGIAGSRIVVLENAIAGPETQPARPADGPCRLLFLGRIEPEKGVGELVAALADPRLRDLAWHATLAGAGDIAGYRRLAETLGIAPDRIEFAGWQPEPAARALLGACDVFVLPSHFEGLPMAILEAMAFGLAIVCTPVGSIPAAVEHEVSALFVPVGDAAALADALVRLVREPATRRALQDAARARFNRKFDIDLYCSALGHIYAEVLSEHFRATGGVNGRPRA